MTRRFASLLGLGLTVAAIAIVGAAHEPAEASTAAFAGDVIQIADGDPQRDGLRKFTVRINYLDYISWGHFGAHTKIGETITRKVMPKGTVCVLNGRLTNAATFARAVRPGAWGYFYEDTWLDLFTTPDFQWGEVVAHDAAAKKFDLKVHRTHKEIHLEANPPEVVSAAYDAETAFRIEDKASDPAAALVPGRWAQVHPARPQIVDVRTDAADYDPAEWLPHTEVRRGYANDLTAPAVLKGGDTKHPAGVLDVSVTLSASRLLGGQWEDVSLNCRKVSFILDGKPCPVGVAVRPGRHAVLCHYRSETSPHKVFVRSFDDAARGTV